MHWFRRPPYLRWAAAGIIVMVAIIAEFRPTPRVEHPYLRRTVEAGSPLTGDDLQWRTIPAGVLPAADPEGAVAARRLHEGEPLLPSHLTRGTVAPPGWWGVPLRMPATAVPGSPVRVVVTDPVATVDGVVLEAPPDDPFAIDPAGLVAVPPEAASLIAEASTRRAVIVLVSP